MKREPRLRGLSSDHHHALLLARALADRVAAGRVDADAARDFAARFDQELEPHFLVEEQVLLAALRQIGEAGLVQKTEADHAFLRAQATRARAGQIDGLGTFAERLVEHVRFEERELLPCCEAKLSAAVLDELERRTLGTGTHPAKPR
jgi:hemerythrin-like domain-containing protein